MKTLTEQDYIEILYKGSRPATIEESYLVLKYYFDFCQTETLTFYFKIMDVDFIYSQDKDDYLAPHITTPNFDWYIHVGESRCSTYFAPDKEQKLKDDLLVLKLGS